MPRRRSSTAHDLIDIVAAMPWWVGVALAVVSYLVFTALSANVGAPTSGIPIVPIAAGVLRWVAPLLCILGAATSAFGRWERRTLLDAASGPGHRQAVQQMTWQQFETLLSAYYRREGYDARDHGGRGPDGGVDLVLRREGRKTFVQCKHWKERVVGVGVVRELLGVITAHGADAGHVVTSGAFSAEATAFAAANGIELFDGQRLSNLMAGAGSGEQGAGAAADYLRRAAEAINVTPACPKCGKRMVRRVAQKGPNAGRPFWGCEGFPGCRGTLDICSPFG